MPQNVDNSSGGQAWVPHDHFGLPRGTMMHTSYGAAALLYVMTERVDNFTQGGVVRLPLSFDSGIMRARFSPADGHLYLSGLKGWQTAGPRDGSLHRVRYTGRPLRMPIALHIHENGLRLTFREPLDRRSAEDPDNYSILQWNYRWTKDYGSRHWSVENPRKQGYDEVTIESAVLLADGRTVFLEIPDIQPVMQMQISYGLKDADGADVKGDVFNTIHALGGAFNKHAHPD